MDHLKDVRIIALDLDGTLLNSAKDISRRTRAALENAAGRGIEIVPATGRFYRAIPDVVRELPFIRHAITINGASVLRAEDGKRIYSALIENGEALEFFEYLDTLPVIYDCYVDDWGYMNESMRERVGEYGMKPFQVEMMRKYRTGIPNLIEWLRKGGFRPQKMQLFLRNPEDRDPLIGELSARFPRYAVTTSLPNNIEVNAREADKGLALAALAEELGVPMARTMAFGDGLNDCGMLRMAGTGVSMAGGHPAAAEAADLRAEDCDSDGVAKIIEKYVL